MQISTDPQILMKLSQYKLDKNLILSCFVIFSINQQTKYWF